MFVESVPLKRVLLGQCKSFSIVFQRTDKRGPALPLTIQRLSKIELLIISYLLRAILFFSSLLLSKSVSKHHSR